MVLLAVSASCAERGVGRTLPGADTCVALPGCESAAPPGACFTGRVPSPPIVVGPGRMLALIERESEGCHGITHQPGFFIREITDHSDRVFAEGLCPGNEPSAMAELDEGRIGVVCSGITFGEVPRSGGQFRWLWSEQLQEWRGNNPGDVIQFAELGGKIVLVYRMWGTKGLPPVPDFAVQVAPGPAEFRSLCGAGSCADEVIKMLVLDGTVHVVWTDDASGTERRYFDSVITPSGSLPTAVVNPEPRKAPALLFDPIDGIRECFSKGRDGVVTFHMGGRGTVRYARAKLPQGPDVYPTELADCPPRWFDDPTQPARPPDTRKGIRATFGSDWVLAYSFAPTEFWWVPEQFPGSLRILRGKPRRSGRY